MMRNVVVTGGSGGLGREIVRALQGVHNVVNLSLHEPENGPFPNETYVRCDVADRAHVEHARWLLGIDLLPGEHFETVVNCAGINHIDWFENLSAHDFDRVMGVNVKGIMHVTQAFLPDLIELEGTVLNIVSNASHMPMTHSFVYNASKGAAHIATLQMARELTRRFNITVFGISPAKIAGTGMSRQIEQRVCELRGWTPEEADEYQRQSLLTGQEIDPAVLAQFISYLLAEKTRHEMFSGCVIPYGA